MIRKFSMMMVGLAFLASPVLASQYKCTGREKGINSMTGKERVIPITLYITINNDKATIKGFDNILFNVKESRDLYVLKASIGKSHLMGEYTLRIDKRTGNFKGKSWLFSRDNIDTKEGRCERTDGHGNP